MDLQLNGKTAIVTGGSRGIGKAVARVLAADGCSVVIAETGSVTRRKRRHTDTPTDAAEGVAKATDRSVTSIMSDASSSTTRRRRRPADAPEDVAEDIAKATGGSVTSIAFDMSSADQVNAMAASAADALGGRIDILVNNVAVPRELAWGALSEISDDVVLPDLDATAMGYLRCAYAVAPYMRRQGWGRIVNIGGLSAHSSNGEAGLSNLTKYLAEELASAGVCVNLVHPGTLRFKRSGPMYEAQAELEGTTVVELQYRTAFRNYYHRSVDAETLAWVVAFLASPLSVAISGESIAAKGTY